MLGTKSSVESPEQKSWNEGTWSPHSFGFVSAQCRVDPDECLALAWASVFPVPQVSVAP